MLKQISLVFFFASCSINEQSICEESKDIVLITLKDYRVKDFLHHDLINRKNIQILISKCSLPDEKTLNDSLNIDFINNQTMVDNENLIILEDLEFGVNKATAKFFYKLENLRINARYQKINNWEITNLSFEEY